jgi:hypothetical protein
VSIEVRLEPARILHLDVELRPLTYLGDVTTGEITAIAWSWADDPEVWVELLEPPGGRTVAEMLEQFLWFYNEADIVTGHFVRGFDLPVIQGALLEHGLPALGEKLVSDTKLDLLTTFRQSLSQESLGEMLGAPGKYHMTQPRWRQANRLTEAGREQTRRRIVSDVRQHKRLRRKLIERGWLAPPTLWTPTTRTKRYRP